MKKLSLLFLLVFGGCSLKYLPTEMGNPKWGLDVTWHGHSCFTLKDSVGRTLVIDPFDETVGYGRLFLRADALLITHRHFDHAFVRAVKPRLSEFQLLESTGTTSVASGLLVTGLTSFHDNESGQIHGSNLIYTFVMGGLRCLHVGDLGQNGLTPYQKKMIGVVDVLFVPVGGQTSLDGPQAKALVDELKPGMVFPMHYGDVRFYKFDPVEKFTTLFPANRVIKVNESNVRIKELERTADPMIYILNPTPTNF